MKIFLAGIMQGSHLGTAMHNQDYRRRLCDLLATHLPEADVYDPLRDNADSINYDAERGKAVFCYHNRLCREVDIVIAFVPEASMGTAIEMWEAHEHGRIVVTISPLKHNWAVRFLSHILLTDMGEFEEALTSGVLRRRIEDARMSGQR